MIFQFLQGVKKKRNTFPIKASSANKHSYDPEHHGLHFF